MIAISSGHGLHARGARDIIDEVDEARRVTDRVYEILKNTNVPVSIFHENTARTQNDNVNAIVRHHNSLVRNLDVSIHFNAPNVAGTVERGIGVETMYRVGNAEMRTLGSNVSKAISRASGLILRRGDGTWERDNLGFLTRTNINRAILIEVCFVNSRTDVRLYRENFEAICHTIAETVSGQIIKNVGGKQMNDIVAININGVDMDIEGLLHNGASFARIPALIEALGIGASVNWNNVTRRVEITVPQRANENLPLGLAETMKNVTPEQWRQFESMVKGTA